MNRLMKAEWYRLTHSKNLLRLIIIGALVLAILPLCSSLFKLNEDLTATLLGSGALLTYMFLMVFPPAYSMIAGKLYDKGKLGYYEVMAGNSVFNIVGSKILTTGLFLLGLTTVAMCAFYTVIAICNGCGTLDNIPFRFLLLLLMLAQTIFCSILITMATNRFGALLCYTRFIIFDSAFLPFLMWLAGSVCGFKTLSLHISHMSIMNRMMMLISDPISTKLVMHTIFGFIFEVSLWYALIHSKVKNRNFR